MRYLQPALRALWTWLIATPILASVAVAGTISVGGLITQPQDPTNPAANNPSLNNIQISQPYSVNIALPGSITAPGAYNLTGSTMTFSVPAAPAMETSFGSITLTVTAKPGFDDFSLQACLTTGSGCTIGNELTANFEIPASMFNSQNVPAVGLDQPHPLDLLEDDASTDIHGSITSYSNTGSTTATPEPSTAILLGCGLAVLLAVSTTKN